MGIFGALAVAVSGLRAQASALENISGNIANSKTIGYKRMDTDFVDLIPDAPLGRQVPGAVLAQSRSTNNDSGDIVSSSSETNIALNGTGFFVVEKKVGQNDGSAIFGGTNYYTRRGDFELDKDGYLVNGAGYFLKGLSIDAGTGNISGSVPQVIKTSNAFLAAQGTTRVKYALNLPQLPKNVAYTPSIPGSELLKVADYAVDPTVAGTGVVQGANGNKFLEQSIAGGAITSYASNGSPVNVQLRWAKIDSAATGAGDKWNLFYLSDSTATGTNTMWTNSGTDYSFDPSGSLSPAINSLTLSGLTIDGTSIGNVVLDHGAGGVSQFAEANGQAQVTTLSQDGYSKGEFLSVAVNNSGRIVASYSNGQQVEIASIVRANFNAVNQLKRQDGGIFSATSESGNATYKTDGGIIGASVESSNTDISQEFTKLIVTQQAYAAGTRIVSTSSQMLKEALNMLR